MVTYTACPEWSVNLELKPCPPSCGFQYCPYTPLLVPASCMCLVLAKTARMFPQSHTSLLLYSYYQVWSGHTIWSPSLLTLALTLASTWKVLQGYRSEPYISLDGWLSLLMAAA